MRPFTVAFGAFTLLNTGVDGPLTSDQVPVPFVMVLPVSVTALYKQTVWSAPTVAVVGISYTVNFTLFVSVQLPRLMVHNKE